MMRGLAMLVLCASAWSCAETTSPMPPAPAPRSLAAASSDAGSLDVTFANNLGWPYRLESLIVVLDGQLLYRRAYRAEERDRASVPIARLPSVATGDHTLQLMATVSYPTGSFDEACLLTLKTAKTFNVSSEPAWVHVDAHAAGVLVPFAERVSVTVRTHDSEPAPEVPSPPRFDVAADVCN